MFNSVLIANRGEIACRIARTAKRLGMRTIAVYSVADAHALHTRLCDEAYCIGEAEPRASYLSIARLVETAKQAKAECVHPGYGFLSENADFAEACEAAGVAFIGPTAEQIRSFGLKHTSRELAQFHCVPLLPGSKLLMDAAEAQREAGRIGYPVMLKSTAGGGGIGMQLCQTPEELAAKFETVRNLGRNNFKDDG